MRNHVNVLAIMIMATIFLSCNNNAATEASATEDSATSTQSPANASAEPQPSSKQDNSNSSAVESSMAKEAILMNKKISFKQISFDVSVTDKIASQLITIKPVGIAKQLDPIIVEVASIVTNVETGDLNKDGYPELLIYTKAGNAEYGSVVGYTVNKDETVSPIEFPELFTSPNAKAGYQGHDQFSIVNNVLTRKFPLYDPKNANSKANGKDRMITYKMTNGKKYKKLAINLVSDIPVQ